MNLFKKSLHVWITLTSFAGFLAGWIFLAQAARQTVSTSANLTGSQTVMSFPTIQTVDNLLHGMPATPGAVQAYKIDPATSTPVPQPTLQPPPQPQVMFFVPPIRTRGS